MLALGVVLLVVGGLIAVVGSLMVVVAAFRVSTTWGLLVLFVPFAGLVFLFQYWTEARRGFLISVGGVVLVIISMFLMPVLLAGRGMAELQEQMDQTPTFSTRSETPAGFQAQPAVSPTPTPDAFQEALPTPSPSPTPRPRPTRAPTPTPPPEDEYALSRAADHVGERLIVRLHRGGEFTGRLLEVTDTGLKFERRLATGMMSFTLPSERIRSLQPAD